MRLNEMTEEQRRLEALFVEKLSAAGWSARENADALRAGMSVQPEGLGVLSSGDVTLNAQLHLEEGVILFHISSKSTGKTIRLRFEHGGNLSDFLKWLVGVQASLTPETFAKFLKPTFGICDQVYFVDGAGNHYQLGIQAEEGEDGGN